MELFEHVGITVHSLSQSIAFYDALLDAEPFHLGVIESLDVPRLVDAPVDSLRVAFYRLPGTPTTLELVECTPASPPLSGGLERPGQVHLCFYVASIERTIETLLAMGIAAPKPVTLPGPQGVDAQTLFIRDPDGTPLQLVSTSNHQPRF